MVKLSIMGQECYVRFKPTFPGSKSGILCKMPSTADRPTLGQKKVRTWLISNAHGLVGKMGAVSDAGNGKGGTALGLELSKKAPGKGAFVSEWKDSQWGAKRKRKSEEQIRSRLTQYAT